MIPNIRGLHHVTATVGYAQEDLDFYTKLLGLRLVKRTVNFDNRGVYHFYYADARGTPGTVMTTFPYAEKGVRIGAKGAGQITVTSFAVPVGSLGFWRNRLASRGAAFEDREPRFGEDVISFRDPSDLVLELVESEQSGSDPWLAPGIESSVAIRGIHSVSLEIRDVGPTLELLQSSLGLHPMGGEGSRTRVRAGGKDRGQFLDIIHVPDGEPGINGIGTVHHVALAIRTDEEQRVAQQSLREQGYNVTEVRDRQYFHSIYFREPGGVLIELATEGPGFLIDEDEDDLGQHLMLPPWEEPRRSEIEAILPEIVA